MFCQKCGHKPESPGGVFCMKCGTPFASNLAPPPQAQVQPPPQDPYGQTQPQFGQMPSQPQPTKMQPPPQGPYGQPQGQPVQMRPTPGPRPTPQGQFAQPQGQYRQMQEHRQMQAQPSNYHQTPKQQASSSRGKSPKLFILIGSSAAAILIAVLLFIFLGGNPIVGRWESQDGWGDWHERVVFNRNGTVEIYGINVITGEVEREDNPGVSIRWSIYENILTLEFFYFGELEDRDTFEFRVIRNLITGNRYLGILDGGWWDEYRRVGR